jgi:hypothetical protein
MDVTGADLGKWQGTATNHGIAAGLFEGDSVPCRDDTTLDDRLRRNQGKSRRGLGLEIEENDMRSIVSLVVEDEGLGAEEGSLGKQA